MVTWNAASDGAINSGQYHQPLYYLFFLFFLKTCFGALYLYLYDSRLTGNGERDKRAWGVTCSKCRQDWDSNGSNPHAVSRILSSQVKGMSLTT